MPLLMSRTPAILMCVSIVMLSFSTQASTSFSTAVDDAVTSGGDSRFITGEPDAPIPDANDRWSFTARHLYSKVQPWNCDQSLLWLSNRGARREQVFLDGDTFEIALRRAAPGTELRWLPSGRYDMLFVNDNVIGKWNVLDNSTEELMVLDDLGSLMIGPYEGNLSHDGRWIALLATHVDSQQRQALVIDLERLRVVSTLEIEEDQVVDWVSMSASGRFVVINGQLRDGGLDQTQIFNRRFVPVGEPWLNYGEPSHYDLTLDAAGRDIAVGVSKSDPHDGQVIKRQLSNGRITALTDSGYASHTSARNRYLLGWVFVTYQGRLENWPPYSNEIVAVATDGSGEVRRLARFPDAGHRYWAQPQAVPSPRGDQVIWAEVRVDGPVDINRQPGIGTKVADTGF